MLVTVCLLGIYLYILIHKKEKLFAEFKKSQAAQ